MITPTTRSQITSSPVKPAAGKITLASVVRGRQPHPYRFLVYGTEGIGKSTLAASADRPVFICPEDGVGEIDVARFPAIANYADALEAIHVLIGEPHDYQTLVIDTVDWLEPLLWAHICARDGKKDIEDYGYGKGYTAALDEYRRLLAALERLRKERGMHLILVGHSIIRTWKNPEGEDFDRYQLKIHDKAAGLLKEWCDCVLFLQWETLTVEDDRKHVKGVTGSRVIRTQRAAAWDAKNRFDLPDRLPLSWMDLWAAIQARQPAAPERLREEVAALVAALGDEAISRWVAEKAPAADAAGLAKIKDRLAAKLAQKNG